MGRNNNQATTAATSAQDLSNEYAGNAAGLFGALAPTLESQMANPQGFGPTTIAQMDTAAQQSAGGSQAAAVGQGALRAARTRNAGAGEAATAASTRSAGQQLSQAALRTQLANAQAKMQQQGQAESGLEGLFSTNAGLSVNALGEVAQNVNANTNAVNASWDWAKDLFDPMLQDATAYASSLNKGGG